MRWLPFALGSVLATQTLTAQIPVAVPHGSGRDAIVQLAACVRPSARQVAWQQAGCNAEPRCTRPIAVRSFRDQRNTERSDRREHGIAKNDQQGASQIEEG